MAPQQMPEEIRVELYRASFSVDMPITEMTDDQFVAFVGTRLLDSALGGIGSRVASEILAEMFGRPRSLSHHLNQLYYRLKKMIDNAIRDARLDELNALTESVLMRCRQYQNNKDIVLLQSLTNDVADCIALSKSPGLRDYAWKGFSLLAALQIGILRERADRHRDLGTSQSGELNNIKETVRDYYLPHYNTMIERWKSRVVVEVKNLGGRVSLGRTSFQPVVIVSRKRAKPDLALIGVSNENVEAYFNAVATNSPSSPLQPSGEVLQRWQKHFNPNGHYSRFDVNKAFDTAFVPGRSTLLLPGPGNVRTEEAQRYEDEAWAKRDETWKWLWEPFAQDFQAKHLLHRFDKLVSNPGRNHW